MFKFLTHLLLSDPLPSSSLDATAQRPPGHPQQDRAPEDHRPTIKMTRHPSAKGATFHELADRYGAVFFRDALKRFVVEHNSPVPLTSAQVERTSAAIISKRFTHS